MPILLERGRDDRIAELAQGAGNGRPGTAGEPARLLVPGRPEDLAGHYDLTISHPAVDVPQLACFERWLAEAAGRRGLTCALIHDGVVQEAVRRLQEGRLSVHFHLDYYALWHVAGDPYGRLAQAVQDAGGRPVNPPARSRLFTDKAAAHTELQRLGLGVPATVLFRAGAADRRLTEAERRRLRLDEPGARVYVKPANGFSRRGVVRVECTDPEPLQGALAAARAFDRQDAFLVQREVHCPVLACDDGVERPAYWRVLYCLGDVIPFWWGPGEPSPERPSYRRVTESESRRHGLWAVPAFASALAEMSGLDWFSTEVCLSEGPEESRYVVRGAGPDGLVRERPLVAIDYVNDQCDVDVQSRWSGAPPETFVRYVAERFAAAAAEQADRAHRRAFPLRLRTAA